MPAPFSSSSPWLRAVRASLIATTAAVVLAGVPARADTLVYADGRRVEGRLLSVSRGWIEFQPLEGEDSVAELRVAVAEVRAIQFDDGADDAMASPRSGDGPDDEPVLGSRERRRGRGGVRRTGLPGREGPAAGTGDPARRRGRMITVDATQRWTDSGMDVTAGDVISFSVSGTVTLGDDRPLGAEGDLDGAVPAARRPMPDRPAGALIGRIGTSPDDTFFIGTVRLPFRVRTSGRLFLGVNDDTLDDDTGAFQVSITRGAGTASQ